MKLLIAIIQPPKLKAVTEALRRIGVSRLTVGDAMGYARQRGQDETYRGAEYRTNLLRKLGITPVRNKHSRARSGSFNFSSFSFSCRVTSSVV